MTKEQCDAYYRTIQKSLEKEEVHICIPNDEQLLQFERIYRERIDIFTQSFYTIDERKLQRDKGYIRVLVDKYGSVLAIELNSKIDGGAVAVKSDNTANIYISAFFIDNLKRRYQYEDEHVRSSLAIKNCGWIAARNIASIRVHDMFGFEFTNRAFDQFIIPGYA